MFHNMFRRGSCISGVARLVLGAALLASPCGVLAQHGGGGHGTGGDAGGTASGLSGPTGRATGLSEKDDLKDFHAALAVQATSQQIIEYGAMLKSTTAASAELQALLDELGKQNNASKLAIHDATLAQALEKARMENQKFLDGFSDPQKSGLKEISKKLTKAEADLAQQAKALDQEIGDAKAVGPSITISVQSLERTLTSFRSQQLDLGEEMSIGAANNAQDSAFNLAPVKSSVNFANQPIAIITSGVISKGVEAGSQNTFKFELTADLSDLQLNITGVLRAQLNKANRCGERIEIQNATLAPLAPGSLVVTQLHFERWACATTFGRETMSEMAEGNGTIELKLAPAVGEDGTLRIVSQMGHIDAEGLVGELLRSGSLGDALRDKVMQSLLSIVSQGEDFKTTLPPAAQGNAVLRHAQFQGTGAGKLLLVLDGEIRVSNEKVTALTGELKGRSSSQAPSEENVQEVLPR
jgi:hypothetical protein